MQKRGVTLLMVWIFLLFLLILPSAFSIYEELLYSGTVKDGSSLNASGRIFEFKIDPVSKKTYVEMDASAIIIDNGECKIRGDLDLCIRNVSFDYRNYTIYYDVYKALFSVYLVKSKISATNTIKQSNLLLEEETTAELAIKNDADITAKEVIAAIKIPQAFAIIDAQGCSNAFDRIVFSDEIAPRETRKCVYKIKALESGNFELKANLSYFDGIAKAATVSNTLSIKVYNYSLKINPYIGQKFNIGEKISLIIELKNVNDLYSAEVTSLSIKIPENLLILKAKGLSINNKIASWSGTLKQKESNNLTIDLQALMTGNYPIFVEASYKEGAFQRTLKNSLKTEIYCECPYILHDFSQKIEFPGQKTRLVATISNPSHIHDFNNVKIDYATNIPNIQDFSTVYDKIPQFGSINIFDSLITAPYYGEIYYFNITISYKSFENEIFIVKDNILIAVPNTENTQKTRQNDSKQITEPIPEPILLTERTGSKSKETMEEEKNKSSKEIPTEIAWIEAGQKKTLKPYVLIGGILFLITIFVAAVMLKRRREGKKPENYDDIDNINAATRI